MVAEEAYLLTIASQCPWCWATFGKRANAILLVPDGTEAGGARWMPGRVSGYDPNSCLFSACPAGPR